MVRPGDVAIDGWKRGLRLPAEERREQLLDAAIAVIQRDGFDALSVEAAAAAAGVSRALAYNYFDGLDGLLSDLYDREFSAIYHRLGPALASEGTFEQRIERKVAAYFDFIDERRRLLAQLWRNMSSAQLRADRQRRWDLWERFVADILREEFVVDDEVARSAARLLMSIDDRCVNLWYERKLTRDVAQRMSVQFQLAGLHSFLQRRSHPSTDEVRPGEARDARAIEPRAQEIIDRVRMIVRRGGPDTVTIRRLADECSMRPADLYRYFADKAAIADCIRAEIAREYEQTIVAALLSTPRDLPTRLARDIVELVERNIDAFSFAIRHGSPSAPTSGHRLDEAWAAALGDPGAGRLAAAATDGIVLGALLRGHVPSVESVTETIVRLTDAWDTSFRPVT